MMSEVLDVLADLVFPAVLVLLAVIAVGALAFMAVLTWKAVLWVWIL